MLKFLKKSRTCRVILVEKTDRLYRNLKDWVSLDEMDLEIHLVKEGLTLSDDRIRIELLAGLRRAQRDVPQTLQLHCGTCQGSPPQGARPSPGVPARAVQNGGRYWI